MVIRQLTESQYAQLYTHLISTAYIQPLDASCTIFFPWEDGEYHIKLQLEEDRSIAVLQAIRVSRAYHAPWFELITDRPTLTAFLDRLMVPFSA